MTTNSESQALDALRLMARVAPPMGATAAQQTLRVWPMLHMGDKVRYYAAARQACERVCQALRGHQLILGAEAALEAQSRLFI